MTSPTPSLAPTYTCKFCRRTFALNGPPIIGEKVEERVGRLSQTLWKHLGEVHKNETAQILLAGNQFSAWLMFSQFENNDAELFQEAEKMRHMFRQTTKRTHISDEEITEQVRKLDFETATVDITVIALLKAMRNTLEEITPQKP